MIGLGQATRPIHWLANYRITRHEPTLRLKMAANCFLTTKENLVGFV